MPVSSHAAREGHVILRVVLIALSILVLMVCALMWWYTASDTYQSMAGAHAPPVVESQA
ncbi:hypothetical protein [Dyella solisilvae]|uniref:hypothetical protein n=1 Tax=Dyella solisilvae TaxID=1920168 RepID=UPI0013142B20|nr:hypothetical protein [Dyella solisilvae]